MKYAKLVKDIRVELSEAVVADKEKAYSRAKACLLHVHKIIGDKLKGELEDEGHCKVD